ncbi:hypothetical protein BRC71_05195 [Halobacteriales archaeon QH_7_65_31]|nr:MAG: hypothetical protein BRC71_05195 [Halobacteriales archaeon QH_7_65_31]
MHGDLQIGVHVEVGDRLFLSLGQFFPVPVLLLLGEFVDVSAETARDIISEMVDERSWRGNPYVAQFRDRFET